MLDGLAEGGLNKTVANPSRIKVSQSIASPVSSGPPKKILKARGGSSVVSVKPQNKGSHRSSKSTAGQSDIKNPPD
jgi:hypothetical protein